MKKILILISILSIALLISMFSTVNSYAATYYVDPSQGCDPGAYNTVSDAILAASDGDFIILCVDLIEEADFIFVDKNITISGFYGGTVHTWTLNDTDTSDYTISVASNKKLVLQDIDIIFQKDFGTVGEYGLSIILSPNSELIIEGSYLESIFGNTASNQIFSDTSKLLILDSTLYAHGPSSIRNVFVLDSNLTAVNTFFEVASWGAPIQIEWTNTLYNYYLNLFNSEVISSGYGIYAVDISWISAVMELENITFYTSDGSLVFNYIFGSSLETNMVNVSIFSDDEGIFYNEVYTSYIGLYITNSTLNTSYETIYIDDNEENYFYVEIDPSVLTSEYSETIYVYEADYSTELYIIVEETELYAYDDDAIYIDYVNDYSYTFLWLEDVFIYSYYNGIYIYDVYDDGYMEIYIRNTDILADDEVIYIDYVEYDSTLYMEVDPSNLTSINDEVLYIYEVYDSSQVEIIFESTFLYAPDDDAIYIDYIDYDSILNITLRNSEGYSDDNFLYVYEVYDYSAFGLFIESSYIESEWETIYIDYVEYDSMVNISVDS